MPARRHLAAWVAAVGLLFSLAMPLSASQPVPPDLTPYPWPYVRSGPLCGLRSGPLCGPRGELPLMSDERPVEVAIVGDLLLGRGVSAQSDPLDGVTDWLRTADLALGNLEGVIGSYDAAAATIDDRGIYLLWMPPSAVTMLADAGFDLLGMANNHTLDFGTDGMAETVWHLKSAGITPLGPDDEESSGTAAVIREVRGVRLAFLAFNMVPYPDADPCPAESEQDYRPTKGTWDYRPTKGTWDYRPTKGAWDYRPTKSAWDYRCHGDLAALVGAIGAARSQADAVIVLVHWGYEYQLRVDPAQRTAAQAMLDAGADLVVGHHPHVVQPLSISLRVGGRPGREGFVAYSLGNFVFDQQFDETRYGLALRVFFDHDGLRAVQALPLRAGPRPRLMSPMDAGPLLARLGCAAQAPQSRVLFECAGADLTSSSSPLPVISQRSDRRENGDDLCRRVQTTSALTVTGGILTDGAIDLTGDGVPQEVRLRDGQVTVSAATSELTAAVGGQADLWHSPPQWRVVDAALGDPNDDGRGELLLAMWKPDESGQPRSHPFVIGYREGLYRTLWGGSAVVRPLSEVELGDVDGDGVQELIVLEEKDTTGSQSVSVWRWHGWGFSQLWRSPPGRYHNLVLASRPEGGLPLIGVSYPVE